MKLKHPLDWYNENTPSEDEEYEKGCLSIALIVVIINGCNFILRTKNWILIFGKQPLLTPCRTFSTSCRHL